MTTTDKIKAYLRANDIEKSAKEKEQQIKAIVKVILKDKTAKQSIEQFNNIKVELNNELLKILKQSSEDVDVISEWITEI